MGSARLWAMAAACLLVGCSGFDKIGTVDPRFGISSNARLVEPGQPVPKGGGTYRLGSPYSIGGRTYVPAENPHYRAEGVASWYGEDFHGRLTAFYGSGLAPVRVEYIGKAPLEGSDDNMLIATLRQGEPAPAPSLIRVASAKPFVPELTAHYMPRNVPVPPERPY